MHHLVEKAEERAANERGQEGDNAAGQREKDHHHGEGGGGHGAEDVEDLQDLVDDEAVEAEELVPGGAILELEAAGRLVGDEAAVDDDREHDRGDERDEQESARKARAKAEHRWVKRAASSVSVHVVPFRQAARRARHDGTIKRVTKTVLHGANGLAMQSRSGGANEKRDGPEDRLARVVRCGPVRAAMRDARQPRSQGRRWAPGPARGCPCRAGSRRRPRPRRSRARRRGARRACQPA